MRKRKGLQQVKTDYPSTQIAEIEAWIEGYAEDEESVNSE